MVSLQIDAQAPRFVPTKVVDKATASVGETITYTLAFTNTGNNGANNAVVIDTLSAGVTFQTNSVELNGVTIAGANPSAPTGVSIGTVLSGSVRTVTFNVVVNTIPSPNPILNSSISTGSFIQDPSIPSVIGINANSNVVTTQINNANLNNITKSVSKAYVTCGDEILYSIVIPNTGNVTAQNIIIRDTILNRTSFIANSVYINGSQQVGANPSLGITVPNIGPNEIITVNFSVKVIC